MFYLLYTTSFVTFEEVRNYKSLQSFKYFIAGWVIEHRWKLYPDCCLVIGKVNHSYAMSSTPLQPWVVIKNSGAVACGHCTCMAGPGETCSHVGALLHWLEYSIRKREEHSCTSGPNQWLEPSCVRKVPYLELGNIDFTSPNQGMHKLQQHQDSCEHEPVKECEPPEEEDIRKLFEQCLLSEKVPILFSLEDQPYCEPFSKSLSHLPLALQSLFDPEHLQQNYLELVEAGENMHGILDVTPLQQSHLEKLTRGQAKSRLWMRYRSGRITASRLYQATHTDPHKPALSLIRSICYPESARFTTAATQYGCEHECKAMDAYKSKQLHLHQDMKISPSGFVVHLAKACFGASPDSFVECLCCGSGVVEVKCPYCMKTRTFEDALEKSNFCLEKNDDGILTLKHEHPYYYQCQLQMVATARSYCDFVVWSATEDPHIERIVLDRVFIEEKLVQAEKFFWLAIIPELLGKWFTRDFTKLPIVTAVADTENRSEDDDGTWCYCQTAKGGSMIGCENSLCAIKWFHMSCLRMKKSPKNKWYCPSCHSSSRA